MICDISQNNLRENLENYVNGLIAANAMKGFDPKVITKIIFNDIKEETDDAVKALGIAYHVPSMVFRSIAQNPKFGDAKFKRLGYDRTALSEFIDNLERAEDKILAIAGYVNESLDSIDDIEERVNNVPADTAQVAQMISLKAKGVEAYEDKVLVASNPNKTTIQQAVEYGKNSVSPNETKPGYAYYQELLQTLLRLAAGNSDFTTVSMGGNTGFKLRLMFENDLPKDKVLPGRDKPDADGKIWSNFGIPILVLADNNGNILYFDKEGKKTTEANGVPWYNMLPTNDKSRKTAIESFKATYKQANEKDPSEEEIKNFEDNYNKQSNLLDVLRDELKYNKETPIILTITGGVQGSYTNVDSHPALAKTLSQFKLSNEEKTKGLQQAKEILKDDVFDIVHIKFDNFNDPISLKNPKTIGKDSDPTILDSIVDIMTNDVKVGGESLTSQEKLNYINQFLALKQNLIEADAEKRRLGRLGYTIQEGPNNTIIFTGGGQTLTDKQSIKDFLANNATIHWHKETNDKGSYFTYKLTPLEKGLAAERSEEKDYFSFIAERFVPRVILNETTKRPMITNGYLTFERENTVKEVEQKVIETTKEVVENKIPTNIEEDDSAFEDLKLRSKLFETITTPEQRKRAEKWWKESGLSKAVDSTGKPLFTLNLLFNVVNSDAWADYENAVINLYEGSDYTHAYHEAWHAFSQVYLTKSERNKLYEAVSKLSGSFKVVRKLPAADGTFTYELQNVKFSDAERIELEEFIAEEFRSYAMNGGKFKVKNEKTSVLSKIFDRIWKALKTLVGGSTDVNVYSNPGSSGVLSDIFNTLYTAKTPEQFLPYKASMKNAEFGKLNSGVVASDPNDNLSQSEALLFTKTIDGIFSDIISNQVYNKGNFNASVGVFDNPKALSEIYKVAKARLDAKRKELVDESKTKEEGSVEKYILDNKISLLTRALKETTYGSIADILNGNSTDTTLIGFHKQNSVFKDMFGKLKISKEEAEELKQDPSSRDDNEQTEMLEKNGSEGFKLEANSTESDKLAPAVVLYIIKSLTKIDKQGKPVLNELGFAEPIEFAPFWRQLMDKASGETSVLGLYNRLKEAEDKGFPLFGQLLKKIFINKVEQDKEGKITRVYTPEETLQSMLTVKNSSIGDLWMKFIQATNLHRIDLVSTTIEVDGDGNLILKSGKTTADYQPILKLWANKFQDQSKSLFVGKTKDNINYIKTEQVVKAFINVDKGKYYVNREDYLPFLNSIGIYLTDVAEVRDGLKADDIDYIAEAIVKHNEYYKDISDLKESKITSIRDFLTIDHKAEKITNQASRFNYLAELEAMYSEEYASSMKFTPDGNLKSIHALNSSTTQKVKALNSAQRKDYLFSTNDEYVHMNFLNPEFNPLAKTNILLNSLFSKTEEGQRIKDNFIEIVDRAGTNDIVKGQYDKGGVYAKMGINDKVISDFIATLDGGYMHSVTPGDKSSYFSIVLDKIFTYEGKKNPKLYVDTEAWLKDDNGNYIRGYNPMVKFFQILYPKLEAEVKRINMIKQGWDKIYSKREGFKAGLEFDIFDDILETNEKYKSGMTLKDYLKSEQFFKSLTEAGNIQNLFNTDSALKTAIDSQMNTWFNALREAYSKNIYNPVFGNVKTRFGTDKANTVFSDLIQKNLDANEKARVNSSSIREAGEWSYLVNNFIHKIETTVLLHGDGFQFNHSKDDTTKRASGAQSSGRVFPVDAITNLWINNVVGRRLEEKLIADGLITKKEGKNEVRKHTPIMNSAIMQEPVMGSAFFEMYAELFKKDFENKGLEGDALKIALYGEKDGKIGTGKLKKDGTFDTYPGGKMHPYSKIESADGQGWISFDSYRILKKLEGMWSDDQEAAYSRIVNGETLSPGELIELFPVYKLQYNGPLHTPGQYPAQAFHKFSLFPLIPGAIAGKPIEKISMAMMEQNIDYVLSPTGSKRSYIKPSAEQNGDPVYTGNTSNVKNINEITFTKNPIYVAYLKNQTDVNSFFKEESTFSTQLRKLITAGLYEFGIPTDFYKEGKFKDPEDAILAWGKLTEAEKKQTSEYHRLSERLKDAIEDLVEEAKIELLESIKWTEEDLNKTSKELAAESPEKLKELFGLINKELKEQDFSDHERSILEASSNLDKLDASSAPLATRFEKVIRSILNKRLIRLKLRGEPFVEVSSDYMQQTVKFTKPSEEQQKAYDNFGNGTNGLSSYVVDIKGKKKTLGFRFKRALTRHDERLFNTYFYDQKGSRVPIKNDKGVIIGYEKIGVFDEVDGQKKLNIKASLARLNQMINNNEWLEDDDNKKKIRLVGVRIPLQGDNSAEFGQVAEFLDPSAGTIIIIPAEIVPKSGTDFDVDKMTAYLPYITRTGKLIEKKVSKKSLDDKITKAKEKIDAFKKNKEIIAEFKESKGVKWLDIGEKLFEFREILKKEKKSKNIFLDKKTLEKLLYSKSKELVEYLNNNEEYVKRSFPKAYAFYKKSAAGVSVSEIVEAEKAVSKLYEENNEFRKAFDELKDLQDHKNNYDSVIQNDIIDIMTSILELPGKAISLLSPNATNLVEPVADELKEKISEADGETDYSKYTLTGKSIKGISPTSMYREDYNNKRQQENISGKGSLGITAIESYMNNLLNMVGLTMNKTVSLSITREGKKNAQVIHEIDVPLAHNRLNGKISLTHIMDAAKENSIADIISQLMNGFVDVGKKAWVAYIQGNMEVIPKILFMIEIGVPFKDIAYFVSNPITREYVKEKKKKMSIHSTLMYDESFSSSFDAAVKTKTEIFNNIDLSKLSNDAFLNIEGANANIFGYDAASKELAGKNTFTREALKKVAESKLNYKNKDQVAGFMQYLYIENLIEDYDLVKRAMNPDTKETSDFYGDDARIEEVKKTQELKSIDTEPINKLRTNSLISPLFIQEFAKKLFGRVFRLRNDERINKYLRDLYSHKFKRSGPKKVTGYDMETYITKFKNFLGQYLFANELRQYNSALGTFKAKTTDKAEIVDKAVLEELNQEYDYISSLTPKDEFVQNKANFNNLDLAAFKEAGRQDYIEYALQRQYLAKTVKLEDVVDTKEFAKRKERLQKTASAKYMQKAGQPNDVYEEELNELVFQDYLTNTALKNSYNIWQLFRSGDNTVATELMDIINNYPDLTKVTTFSMLSNFAAEGIPRASYTDRKVKNFKLKNYKALGEGLSDDYKNQWDKLSNPSDKDLINLVPDLKARQYISNFFQTLPLYSFLQTGMDASEFSLASVMPYERYKEIFNKASDKFIAMLDEYSFAKERGNKIEIVKEYNNMLRGLQVLFNDQNRLDNIPYRNRGLNYKKPLDKIAGADKRNPIYSLYDIPYLLPQGNKGVFIMQNSYEQDGVMVEAKIDIEDLESRYTDVVFLTSLNDLTKQADVFNLTTEEIEAAKTSIDAVLNKIISEGSAVVIYPEGLMGKSNITTAKLKKQPTQAPVSTQVITFETAAGSKYTLYPDGKIDRYKTATKEKQETNDLIVFVKFNSSEQMQRFLEGVQEREKSGTKVYVIDNKGNKYSKGLDIKGKDVKLALVDTKTNKVIETVETKQEPTIGYNTYDERRYVENGEPMRSMHIGNKVTEILNNKTADKNQLQKQNIEITNHNYTRQEVQNNPNTAYVFTENTYSITAFPNRAGGGSAIIRGLPNAFAIVTKKKYDYNTKENVDYTDTDANFKEFTEINTKLINELKNSGKDKIVFPQGFATDKAKMPTRFAEWLQKELLNNFGLITELNSTKTGLISKNISQVVDKNQIYSQLGNKTVSNNVVIKSWGELKDVTKAITPQGVVSTRIKNTNEHFGNPFSHDPAGKTQGLIKTETVKEAVEKYIDWVINSQDSRAKWIRKQLQSGELKGKPILYYKELGEPSHATALDYLINKYDWNNKTVDKNQLQNIKKGVNELFEQTPELANAVYEALGIINTSEIQLDKPRFNPDNFEAISYPIKINGKYAGVISVDKDGYISSSIGMAGVELEKEFQGQGYGTKIYIALAEKLDKEGKTLKSEAFGKADINEAANRVWKSLLNKGYAIDKDTYFEVQLKDKQQAQQLYSQYLDSIFPDSKVKDVVYHGTKSPTKFERFINVYEDPILKKEGRSELVKGVFFVKEKNIAEAATKKITEDYKINKVGHIISAIIDFKNPKYDNKGYEYLSKDRVEKLQKEGFDGFITQGNGLEHIVFEPEQIHILGSKQDIEGFKDFVQGKQFQKLTAEEKSKTIEQVTKEHRSIIALKDLAHKLAHRIGGKVEFENKTDVDWKGYNQGMTSVLNEAYMTPDTPFHEILAHPIIKAIKSNKHLLSILDYSVLDDNGFFVQKAGKTIAKFPTREQAQKYIDENSKDSELYQNLLKELETGRGKEVFEQVKRDYKYKEKLYPLTSREDGSEGYGRIYTVNGKDFNSFSAAQEYQKNNPDLSEKYTLEEIQEESIVTLLGMLAADKLDKIKDSTLISKLKELWKQISDFVKSLLRQDGIKIDELPITTTLNDLAEIMAYGNNKIILPGYKVEYSTPLGNKYDTLEEVNQEIRNLADANVEVDLSGVRVDTSKTENIGEFDINTGEFKQGLKIGDFIEKNKEYEQSKEIIEQWKKENNIQYDPEEVYSRGQGFYSSIGAYSNLELDLLLKNLIQHIQDNKKAGGEFTISAFTKPIDKRLKHIEGTGDRVRFVIYPKSEHIKWAAPTDVYSGSVVTGGLDAGKVVSKDKNTELLGVSFTKAPTLRNINEVSPNLADIIDNLSHAHNELGIELTTNNFRIEYDDNIDYSTKKLIDNINKILDDKYGKLVKPEIKQKEFGSKYIAKEESAYGDFKTTIFNTEKEALDYKKSMEQFDDVVVRISKQVGKQPTQTKENTTSIDSIREDIVGEVQNTLTSEDVLFELNDSLWVLRGTTKYPKFINVWKKGSGEITKQDYINFEDLPKKAQEFFKDKIQLLNREYTQQAETNLKIAALKEVARKYPRSLITSKVVPINPNMVYNSEIQYSKVGSKQDVEGFKEILARVGNPILAEIEFDEMTEPEDINEISLYLSRQIHDKFGVKIGPLLPNMLDLLNNQPVINQEDVDNKKLEC